MKPALLLALLLGGCAQDAACPGSSDNGVSQIRAELLFGLGRKDAPDVSGKAWAAFLAETVTPRFPDGLTVLDGRGQWRNRLGRIVSENAKIVLIAAPDTAETARGLREIAQDYDRRFDQEAVGVITERACVAFIRAAPAVP